MLRYDILIICLTRDILTDLYTKYSRSCTALQYVCNIIFTFTLYLYGKEKKRLRYNKTHLLCSANEQKHLWKTFPCTDDSNVDSFGYFIYRVNLLVRHMVRFIIKICFILYVKRWYPSRVCVCMCQYIFTSHTKKHILFLKYFLAELFYLKFKFIITWF